MIGGGARSGKSRFAVDIARERGDSRVFIATAEAFDDEMRARIDHHRRERGDDFATVEEPRELERALVAAAAADVVVVDCLTLWLSNLLLADLGEAAIAERVEALVASIDARANETILVTNEVGMGVVPETALGRVFRDVVGRAHQRLARRADEMYVGIMGVVLRIEPGPIVAVSPGDQL